MTAIETIRTAAIETSMSYGSGIFLYIEYVE